MLPTLPMCRLWLDEQGASSVEYALLASLIAVLCVVATSAVGTSTLGLYTVVCTGVAAATGNPPC